MYPMDILNLARTSTTLRRILISRDSRAAWLQAFRSVPGLPDCPEDLSEPQYAALVFDCHCFVSTAVSNGNHDQSDHHAASGVW